MLTLIAFDYYEFSFYKSCTIPTFSIEKSYKVNMLFYFNTIELVE